MQLRYSSIAFALTAAVSCLADDAVDTPVDTGEKPKKENWF